MKTKQLFLIVSLVWGICFNSFNAISSEMGDTKDIELKGEKKGTKDQRTLLPICAWLDNQTVYVSFTDIPSSATVIISDLIGGEQLIENYVSPTTVTIPLIPTQNVTPFEIVILCGGYEYSGEFEL
jgi:hypothetical protein